MSRENERDWTARLMVEDEVAVYCPECTSGSSDFPLELCFQGTDRALTPQRRSARPAPKVRTPARTLRWSEAQRRRESLLIERADARTRTGGTPFHMIEQAASTGPKRPPGRHSEDSSRPGGRPRDGTRLDAKLDALGARAE